MMELSEIYQIIKNRQVTTDSRNCPEHSVFFALKGERFDGNKYAKTALDGGCDYAIVDNPELALSGDARMIVVENVLDTLQKLAKEHRQRFTHPVMQVTGTNGKTTTKELLYTVLSKKYNVLATEGNLNNHIGVPLTLLKLREKHTMAVIETGANHPGEIKTLTDIVQPDFGLITNVGRAHLAGFGSFEGVKKTKGELYDYFRRENTNGHIFLNAANEHLCQMAGEISAIRYGYGQEKNLNVVGELDGDGPYMKMKWHQAKDESWQTVQTHLVGSYNLDNALAAACVGSYFGVSPSDISDALETYEPKLGRSEYRETAKNRLVVDAYNANPTSMMLALENFDRIKAQHKMVILGEMRELGEDSQREHQKIADLLINMNLDEVWLVGDEFAKVKSVGRLFHDVEEVKTELSLHQLENMLILLKGSNGTRLFELPELL